VREGDIITSRCIRGGTSEQQSFRTRIHAFQHTLTSNFHSRTMPSFTVKQLCSVFLVIVIVRCSQGYFAFPRQGRAMSFYFPRMGRSGDETDTNSCCDGLRAVFTMGRGSFDICPALQECCAGLEQRTKIIKSYVITECLPSEKLENIRELMNEDSLQ